MRRKTRKSRKLGSLLQRARAEASARRRRKPARKPAPLSVKSLSLTPSARAELERLLEAASEALGRKVSASAVVRALLRLSEQRDLSAEVLAAVEQELRSGEVVWGHRGP